MQSSVPAATFRGTLGQLLTPRASASSSVQGPDVFAEHIACLWHNRGRLTGNCPHIQVCKPGKHALGKPFDVMKYIVQVFVNYSPRI